MKGDRFASILRPGGFKIVFVSHFFRAVQNGSRCLKFGMAYSNKMLERTDFFVLE